MCEGLLLQGERIDDLQTAGLRLIQNPALFLFGTDSVLLAHFAHAKRGSRWIDLGTGSGVLPLLILANRPDDSFEAVEIQPQVADMAARSMRLNAMEQRIHVHEMNMLAAPKFFGSGAFDAVVCNPPYGKRGGALRNPADAVAIARHELLITLEEVVQTASALVKNGGLVFMVHQAERYTELSSLLVQAHLQPKRVRFLHPAPGKNAHLVLVEALKLGGFGTRFLPPLYIHDGNGKISQEMNEIYAGMQDIV